MSMKIAVAGKGGTGKTTISALLCRALIERKLSPVLAVDADPNSCLAEKLGLKVDRTIGGLREELRKKPDDKPAGIGKSEWIERLINESVIESAGMDLLVMGRQEGPSCYCYINNLLRDCLEQLGGKYKTVVVDNEAGMEHLSRRSNGKVDVLLVVAQPTMLGARTAVRIMELVKDLDLDVGRAYLVLNQCDSMPEGAVLREFNKACIEMAPMIPSDEVVAEMDVRNVSLMTLPARSKAFVMVNALLNKILERREI
ncbi:MAG: hypothetical protein C0404_04630 [Verrucomicrobia bacterium]|nr:hypothetical protein [Verrucomicrobiota bacterium]